MSHSLKERHSFNYNRTGWADSLLLECLKPTQTAMIKDLQLRESKYIRRVSEGKSLSECPATLLFFLSWPQSDEDRWLLTHTGNQIVDGLSKGKTLLHNIIIEVKFQFSIPPSPDPILRRLNLISKSLVTPHHRNPQHW